ncbi:MAG: cupin [Planctomycetota bacterium]
MPAKEISKAEICLPCTSIREIQEFFCERLGFRWEAVFPADDPGVLVLSGYGLRLRFERGDCDGVPPSRLRLEHSPRLGVSIDRPTVGPDGLQIEWVDTSSDAPAFVPRLQPELTCSRLGEGDAWTVGRAGMLYRDLIPGHLGGRFTASQIQIPEGGLVPDSPHFHRVRFQMIYCHRGWVRLVYEDQGPPFVLEAGDSVLQPPLIRHRVLECSAGLEVVEVACPAHHETRADWDLELPTSVVQETRKFGGQRFVRHLAAGAIWMPWRQEGFEARPFGFASATAGLGEARIVRRYGVHHPCDLTFDGEFCFLFVTAGNMSLEVSESLFENLGAGDALVLPQSMSHRIEEPTDDLEFLEVTLPASLDGDN